MAVVAAHLAGNVPRPAVVTKEQEDVDRVGFDEDIEMLDRTAGTGSTTAESAEEDGEDEDDEEGDENEEEDEEEEEEEGGHAAELADDADAQDGANEEDSAENATEDSEDDAEGEFEEDVEGEIVVLGKGDGGGFGEESVDEGSDEDEEAEADIESEEETVDNAGADIDAEGSSEEDDADDHVEEEATVKVASMADVASSSSDGVEEDSGDDENDDDEEQEEDAELEAGDAEEEEDGDDSDLAADVVTQQTSPEDDSDINNDEDDGVDEDTIKPIPIRQKARPKFAKAQDDAEDDESASAAESNSDSEEKSSADEQEWEGASDASEEAETPVLDPSRCIYCGEDEEHDPSDEYEEYMACSACGDNAHPQCARSANSAEENLDIKNWRCPSCVESNIQPERPVSSSPKIRRSSAPKIIRDLMPAQKGVIKPGSHSVFSQLILPETESADGSRALRKRKVSNESTEHPRAEVKRHKRSSPNLVRSSSMDDEDTASVVQVASGPLKDDGYLPRQARQSRARQSLKEIRNFVTVVKSTNTTHENKKRKRKERDLARRNQPQQVAQVSHYPSIQSFTPFYTLYEKAGEENKTKPYGGILSAAEADTTNTFPQTSDRRRFEEARQKAEEEWRRKIEAAQAAENARSLQKGSATASKIKCISFGHYEIDTWHAAPYPEEYSRNRVLYICEFCLKYMNSDFVAWRHKLKCPARHPPGDEIYRDGTFSFFEVDGRKNPVYCQNLCLLAKLFLGSKTLYYDVEPFLFYVMTENDEFGCHFVGYFSKEKRPSSQNNVSCILVLPIHQRRGFGHMLIDFSYLLTRVEKKTGSPEKPLSDMGLVSYRSYWRLVLCYQLLNQKGPLSISDISDRTGMTADDIVCALEGLRALVRDPVTKTYALRLDYAFFQHYIDNYEQKGYTKLNPHALVWVPYIMGRNNMHYEDGPQIHTVARRENEDDLAVPEEGVQLAANGVSEKDYAAGKFGEDLDAQESDFPTPREDSDQQLSLPLTPRARSKGSTPSTPRNETVHDEASPIPATRFEVFPPLPGSAQRRRAGRAFGRSATRRGTPVRRGLNYGESPVLNGVPAPTRKTRSKLGEVVTNGIWPEDEDGHANKQNHDRDCEEEVNGTEGSATEDVLMEDG